MLRRGCNCVVGACCIIFAVICSILQVGGVPFEDFFPFGLDVVDQSLPPSDDEYRQVALIMPFPFAGGSSSELYVRITCNIFSMKVLHFNAWIHKQHNASIAMHPVEVNTLRHN